MSALHLASKRVISPRAITRSKPVLRSARFQTTVAGPQHSANYTHAIAGAGGGLLVFAAAYGYYSLSGAKTAVNAVTTASSTVKDIKNTAVNATPDPKVAIGWLRSAAHSYAAAIPGAGFILDQTFDQLESLADTHADQVKEIVNDTYKDIKSALDDAKGKDIGEQAVIIIQKSMGKIQKLGAQVNKDYLGPLLDKSPELKKALQGSEKQINELAAKHGPKAQKIAEDTMKQVKDISEKGLNGQTIAQIVSLIQTKTKEISSLAADAGSDAYAQAQNAVGPLMEKMPDIKKLMDENLAKVQPYLGDDGVNKVKEVYAELEKLQREAKGKNAAQLTAEAKEIVTSRMGDLQKSLPNLSSGSASGALSAAAGSVGLGSLPGLSEITKDLPNFAALKDVAEKHGDEGKKLLESTYEELKSVLEKKGADAKKLAEKATKDAKRQA